MPEVLTMPEMGVDSEEVAKIKERLEDMLNPNGPYIWDLPPQRLSHRDVGYNTYVCTISFLFGIRVDFVSIIKKHLLPPESEKQMAEVLDGLNAIMERIGMRTLDDMTKIRGLFVRAAAILKGN
ncbi:MAG: hypothetical protein M1400_01490 [Patescibacteria group bacterium]|nr:hypothetical protein [Patescibacteria group bacterium]